jgi:serine/threonine protein kinase
MSRVPGVGDVFGRYQLTDVLGQGGMGIVYGARDTVLDRRVAVKLILPVLSDMEGFRARFEREAAVLAKVHSRNVIKIYDIGEHDGLVYFVTEFVSDGDLQTFLDEAGAMETVAALSLVAQLCEGLQDAHDLGVVHRDIKPRNVLLWRRGLQLVPYLCDFGIAVDGAQHMTVSGSVIGTLKYMAPERHHGAMADRRSDVYSMGCVLYAVLTGDAPYDGSSDYQVMAAHVDAPVPTYDRGRPHDWLVNAVVQQSLAKDPADRFQTAAALGRALEQVASRVPRPTNYS